MLILGDCASFKKKIDIVGIKKNQTILLNCEGYLVEREEGFRNTVFNNIELYKGWSKNFNLILNLANNHTMDVPFGISQSLFLANKYQISTIGGGEKEEQALKPYKFIEDDIKVSILSAGWDIIGCKTAKLNSEGISSLDENRLISQVQKEKAAGYKIVVYLHWNYELEIYPMPTHRRLAKRLIDMGADIIVGCHSHCIQGFEKYKNKYIFYSVGNSVFDEGYYCDGRLKFPNFCSVGLAVEWNARTEEVLVAKSHYKDDTLIFEKFIMPNYDNELIMLSNFSNLNDLEYIDFFKKNRRKRKFLPIFYETDSTLFYKLKGIFVKLRAFVIKKLFLLGFKGSSR